MKVLYISYDGMTDQLGRSQVLPYLCGLSKLGVSYHLVSFEKDKAYTQHEAVVKEITDTHNINWIPLRYTKKPPVISTLKDIRKLNETIRNLLDHFEFDLVHCRSYISAIAGLKLKKKHQIPFLFDMRGFWADERVDGNIWKLSRPMYKMIYNFFKRKERLFFMNSDMIISLTNNGKQEILSWNLNNVTDKKIEVIPCCADLGLFDYNKIDYQTQNTLRKKLGIKEDDFVITYLGAIGTWYMLDEMLDFFKVLISKRSNAKFLFITAEQASFIHEAAVKRGIEINNIKVQVASREEVPLYISLGQLSIFFIKPVFSKKASSPTKQGEIMGMGIPIICNSKVGDTDAIISDSNAGMIVNDFSNEEYEKVCENIDQLLALDKQKIRKGAKKYYSLEEGIKKYYNVYRQITKV